MSMATLPLLAHAQVDTPSTFREAVMLFVTALRGIIAILFASLSVGIVYGVVRYFMSADDADAHEKIRGYLIWAVIGLIVVFGMWALIGVLSNTFGWGAVGIPLLSPPV